MPKLKKRSEAQKQADARRGMRKVRLEIQEEEDTVGVEAEEPENSGGEPRRSDRIKERDRIRHQSLRQDAEYRQEEQLQNTQRRGQLRNNPDFRTPEKAKDAVSKASKRQDPDFRTPEKAKDAVSKASKRQDPDFRTPEKAKDAASRAYKRQDPDFRTPEKAKDAASRASKRQDPDFRTPEKAKDAASRVSKRQDPDIRTTEKSKDASLKASRRKNPDFRTQEKSRDATSRAKKREESTTKNKENELNLQRYHRQRLEKLSNFEKLVENYKKQIREAPEFACSSCGSLWEERKLTVVSAEVLKAKGVPNSVLVKVLHVDQFPHRLCQTCKIAVVKKKVPKLCLTNGFDFPTVPDDLQNMRALEERLVSLRIPFMQLRGLGYQGQLSLRGNVVNVENDLDISIAKTLPRRFDDMSTIPVQLMRRIRYRKPYMAETIRPSKVYKAAKFLMGTELYADYKDKFEDISQEWTSYSADDEIDFNPDEELEENRNEEWNVENDGLAGADALPETESSILWEGAEETLIFDEKNTGILGVRIAPAEGKTPIPLHCDLIAEEASFPTIYCGLKRNFSVKVTYTDIAKSELRRYDRRACLPTKLLYSFKRSFNEKVCQAVQICLRKRIGGKTFTASEARKPQFVKDVMNKDQGYAVFKGIRCSPSYWKGKMQTVTAMVRQLGKCSFFITLSAAETKWTELLVSLMKIVKGKQITEEEGAALTSEEKADLIRSDPVTCMRHFDNRYRALLNNILKPAGGIFGPHELKDYFGRLEFQMRGSPHSHGLYWVEDAPVYEEGNSVSEKKCIEFINKFITCERSEDGDMKNLIGYQIHNHSASCQKKLRKGQHCRFGFPKPPMPETKILIPLPKDFDPTSKKDGELLFQKIQTKLIGMGRSFTQDIPFQQFLQDLQITEEKYLLAVRTSIKRNTVFLRRKTNSIFVNGYNRKLLETWRANIDIQFVLDTYACAKYCVGYIAKAEGGVSKLLQAAAAEIKKGNLTLQERMKQYARILINGSEISAQEAAAFLLQIANTRCSRTDVYINTARPEGRIAILKSKKELDELGEDDTEVCCYGLIDHYILRPQDLEDTCLAEFASMYDYSKCGPIRRKDPQQEDYCKDDSDFGADDETEFSHPQQKSLLEEDEECSLPGSSKNFPPLPQKIATVKKNLFNIEHASVLVGSPATGKGRKSKAEWFELENNSGWVRQRTVRKIIRYRHYSKYEDPEEYAREQVMLFVPWRDEDRELLDGNVEEYAQTKAAVIRENAAPFYFDKVLKDDFLTDLMNDLERERDEQDCQTEVLSDEDDYFVDDFQSTEITQKEKTAPRIEQFRPPKLIPDKEYFGIMRSLNEKQRRIVLYVFQRLKMQDLPFHIFLSGGAGVGKSHVITAIMQSYMRYTVKLPSCSPEDIAVLVSAPTGCAAFNVFGATIHSTFRLPPNNKSGPTEALEEGKANSLRLKLAKTQLFIIDEISMVSVNQLYDIDHRLRQVYSTEEEFGGRSILVVGDLRQLEPVAASHVFKLPKHLPLGSVVGNHLWKLFKIYELHEIMRQKGELEFCKALNNMAEGKMDAEDIALIKSREISTTNPAPDNAIWLFSTNNQCDTRNAEVHASLNTDGALSVAIDKVEGGSNALKAELLSRAKELSRQQSDGLPYETMLKVGGEYFVTTNIDVPDGLFNGALGTLKMIEYQQTSTEKLPKRAWLEFHHPLIGAEKRKETNKYQKDKNINVKWVGVGIIKRKLRSATSYKGARIVRRQIPLAAANAMTINKAQGSSLPFVVVSMEDPHGFLNRERLYVGCSRATTKNGLYIDGNFKPPKRPPANHAVVVEMKRLREAPLLMSLRFLQDYSSDNFEKVYFTNITSFPLHHLDISGDHCAMAANYIAIVEPHLLSGDSILVPNFDCVFRKDCRSTVRNSEGCLLFKHTACDSRYNYVSYVPDYCSNNTHCLFMTWTSNEVTMCVMYKHPNYSNSRFLKKLEDVLQTLSGKGVLLGDINIDLRGGNNAVTELFLRHGYNSRINLQQPSTDMGSHIDCCFSNDDRVEAWFYENYFGIHKPICIAWPKRFL